MVKEIEQLRKEIEQLRNEYAQARNENTELRKAINRIADCLEKRSARNPPAPQIPKIIKAMQDDKVIGEEKINGKYPVTNRKNKPFMAIFKWAGKDRAVNVFTNDMIQDTFCFSDGRTFENAQSITNARNNYFYPKKKKSK
jgi:cell division septum initiation protein DivIVA